jgi:hypothetical protein
MPRAIASPATFGFSETGYRLDSRPSMTAHWLQGELARRQLEYGRDESLQTLYTGLLLWHVGVGTPGATCAAVRQTYVAQLLGEGYTQRETAGRLQIGLRTVERDVAELKRVYEAAGPQASNGAERRAR